MTEKEKCSKFIIALHFKLFLPYKKREKRRESSENYTFVKYGKMSLC